MTTLDIEAIDGYDIHVDANHNLAVAIGEKSILQRTREHFLFWEGEWVFEPTLGMPYRVAVFAYRKPTTTLESLFISEAQSVDGVNNALVTSLELGADRRLEIRMTLYLDDGVETELSITQ